MSYCPFEACSSSNTISPTVPWRSNHLKKTRTIKRGYASWTPKALSWKLFQMKRPVIARLGTLGTVLPCVICHSMLDQLPLKAIGLVQTSCLWRQSDQSRADVSGGHRSSPGLAVILAKHDLPSPRKTLATDKLGYRAVVAFTALSDYVLGQWRLDLLPAVESHGQTLPRVSVDEKE